MMIEVGRRYRAQNARIVRIVSEIEGGEFEGLVEPTGVENPDRKATEYFSPTGKAITAPANLDLVEEI